jgi:hypothetical protein
MGMGMGMGMGMLVGRWPRTVVKVRQRLTVMVRLGV